MAIPILLLLLFGAEIMRAESGPNLLMQTPSVQTQTPHTLLFTQFQSTQLDAHTTILVCDNAAELRVNSANK